jgi:hypothetical protein
MDLRLIWFRVLKWNIRFQTPKFFQNVRVVRRGICFDQIDKFLRDEFGITLADPVSNLKFKALEYEIPATVLAN